VPLAHFHDRMSVTDCQSNSYPPLLRQVRLADGLAAEAEQLGRRGRSDTGLVVARRALAVCPQSAAAHFAAGVCSASGGRPVDAAGFFRRAIHLEPVHPAAMASLATLLVGPLNSCIVHPADSLESTEQEGSSKNTPPTAASNEFAIAPASPPLPLRAGRRNRPFGGRPEDLAEARTLCERALAIDPECADAHAAAGHLAFREGRMDDACRSYGRALVLRPDDYNIAVNCALAHHRENRLAQAIAGYDQAIAISPVLPDAYWNRALALLAAGDFARGWVEHEWRWHRPDAQAMRRRYTQPGWDGGRLDGRTILLWAEQGLGDSLQFARYATEVFERAGGRVLLEVPETIARVLDTVAGVHRVIVRRDGANLPPHDVQAPLMSLPFLLSPATADDIPARVPYLFALPHLVERWRARLAVDGPGLKIGLVWASAANSSTSSIRSMPLSAFAPLSTVQGVRLYGLQKGIAAAEMALAVAAGFPIADLSADRPNMADTAALMAALDLVITVDTAAAHLAGALGRPVWNMLPRAADWRWQVDRADTPWYPTMRLFRQYKTGEWGPVVEDIVVALVEFVRLNGSRTRANHD